ncbi:hypothetical protein NEDG_01132 [Nematocida displodere]|uniref:Uncharacterized protein n=1 Tax=Nematocida displodere TaxID=1805483 RepID=A0A177EAM5_9MICR|nr:hypothetical protein NEDG_01132 [Nematocida displodere]
MKCLWYRPTGKVVETLAKCTWPTVLRKAFLLLTATVLVAASLDSDKKGTEDSCLDSPYTKQTISFFEKAGSALTICAQQDCSRLAKSQVNKITIYLRNLTLESVPDQMTEGMAFTRLIFNNGAKSSQSTEVSNREVVKKVFKALGTLVTFKLTFFKFTEDTEPCSDVAADTAGLKKTTAEFLMEESGTRTGTSRILKAVTTHLYFRAVSDYSMDWVLPCLDLSECIFHLYIHEVPAIKSLLFLDHLNPKGVFALWVYNAKELKNLDCTLLKRQQVLNGLEVCKTPEDLFGSTETLRGIAGKSWRSLALDAKLWKGVAHQITNSFAVKELAITVSFTLDSDRFWGKVYRMQASVKTLKLRLINPNDSPKSKKTLKDLMEWIARCFVDVTALWFIDAHNQCPPEFLTYHHISIDPLLPNLKHLHYKLVGGKVLQLYRAGSTLWISPEAYSSWAQGGLNRSIAKICKKAIFSIYGTQCMSFRATAWFSPNPGCFVCQKTVSEFTQMIPMDRPRYIGIVYKKGHAACWTCLANLLREKQKAGGEPLCCLLCGDKIVHSGFNGVIRNSVNGISFFVLSWVDLEI